MVTAKRKDEYEQTKHACAHTQQERTDAVVFIAHHRFAGGDICCSASNTIKSVGDIAAQPVWCRFVGGDICCSASNAFRHVGNIAAKPAWCMIDFET